jgi:hypothetical protein
MRTGIEQGKGHFVLVTMADGSDEAGLIEPMLTLAKDGAAVVAASRYMKGGGQVGGPQLKAFLSRIAGLSLHFLAGLPIHDATSNFRMYSRPFLEAVTIESEGGFELALELTVKAFAAGLSLAEVPTTWRERTAGQSQFQLRRWLPHYIKWYAHGMKAGVGRRLKLGPDGAGTTEARAPRPRTSSGASPKA